VNRYYTGVTPQLLPTWCSYVSSTYNPTRPGFLLGLRTDPAFRSVFLGLVNSACRQLNVTVLLTPIRTLYPTYSWDDLSAHRGVVALPSGPSSFTLIELYRMNVPIFLPSKVIHRILFDRRAPVMIVKLLCVADGGKARIKLRQYRLHVVVRARTSSGIKSPAVRSFDSNCSVKFVSIFNIRAGASLEPLGTIETK
jgi:hypothetical protein